MKLYVRLSSSHERNEYASNDWEWRK